MPTRRQIPELDEKDQAIAHAVIRYPQATIEELAEQTRIAASTVQKRVADMLARDQLARVMEVRDWRAAHYPLRYRIDIKVHQPAFMEDAGGGPVVAKPAETSADDDPDEGPLALPPPGHKVTSQKELGRYIKNRLARAECFRGRLVCLDVVILMGHAYDLSVTVRAVDANAVTDFVTRGLRFCRAVAETMSSLEAWSSDDEERRSVQVPWPAADERQAIVGPRRNS